jgi:hypothetical protein
MATTKSTCYTNLKKECDIWIYRTLMQEEFSNPKSKMVLAITNYPLLMAKKLSAH